MVCLLAVAIQTCGVASPSHDPRAPSRNDPWLSVPHAARSVTRTSSVLSGFQDFSRRPRHRPWLPASGGRACAALHAARKTSAFDMSKRCAIPLTSRQSDLGHGDHSRPERPRHSMSQCSGRRCRAATTTWLRCSTNPAIGDSLFALISEQQHIPMGRQAARQVGASIGLVDDPERYAGPALDTPGAG